MKFENSKQANEELEAIVSKRFAERTVLGAFFSEELFDANACKFA